MKILFEEKQLLRNNSWIWTLLILSKVLAFIPMAYMLMNPGEKNPKSILLGFIVLIIIAFVASALIYINSLEVKVDTNSVHYRHALKSSKWKRIEASDILTFESKKLEAFDTDKNKENTFIQITSTCAIDFNLRSGKKIRIGTNDPEHFVWAIKRILHNEEKF